PHSRREPLRAANGRQTLSAREWKHRFAASAFRRRARPTVAPISSHELDMASPHRRPGWDAELRLQSPEPNDTPSGDALLSIVLRWPGQEAGGRVFVGSSVDRLPCDGCCVVPRVYASSMPP